WQWRWTEGCAEALATFKNAVQLLKENPQLIFNHNEAILYEWVMRYDPRLFRQIQDLVHQKRWFISGGWFLQPDLNLLPTRNLIKHIREGKKFFKKHFDSEPRVAYNFDSFGHSAGLPGLLNEHGYEFYIHQRPELDLLELPSSLYNWEGSDGSIIPAYRIEIGLYHTERNNIKQRMKEGADLSVQLNRDVAVFWGLGNHGGGATREDLKKIQEYITEENRVNFIHSTPDRFFQSLSRYIVKAPVYQGELQRVFTGTYTSMARLKRKALQASAAASQMEKLSNIIPHDSKTNIDSEKETAHGKIWHDILFNDFHDILTGTCISTAEEDAMDLFGRAMENIREENMKSVSLINSSAMPLVAHIPLTVFHDHSGFTKLPIEFECMSDYRPFWDEEKELILTNREGVVIPCQEEQADALLPFHRWRRKIVFMARDMQPGIHHFGLNPVPALSRQEIEPELIDDPFKVKFIVVRDIADSWGTQTWKWDDVIGEFTDEKKSKRIVSHGSVRTIQESLLSYNNSSIILQVIKYADWPLTEYRIQINWHEEQKRIKLVLPLDPSYDSCTCEIPGGMITRKADGQEHCHGTWMKIGQKNQNQEEICIAHNGLHGYDFVNSELRLSVLRSAAYCHWHEYDIKPESRTGPAPGFMDIGNHDISLAIWKPQKDLPKIETLAEWLNAPALVFPHLPIS
ncbi:MAG: hypothetical protein HN936_02840, partial [Bacteroidetes bacterium]|nr:hypothetical protein [Bacteroidota bacterium]